MLAQYGKYRVDDGARLAHHVAVPEAQDAEALRLEEVASPLVMSAFGFETVLLAVDLDDQLCLQGYEVNDIRPDRGLPAKVPDRRRQVVPQRPPKPLLGLSRPSPHRSRVAPSLHIRRRA
ncbi:hypothetical protein QO011_001420 [Labrys wisconsinensis]|uniref:Uncharacterized protein n=1 Tax=Labrys wisconsinensis TaxID=425677 RepID=A0ABU0J474_9HYPH|nr:hypothetical protein [Labrys wisconsinensis]